MQTAAKPTERMGTQDLQLSSTLRALAKTFVPKMHEQFDFKKIEWSGISATAVGTSGPTEFRVRLTFIDSPGAVLPICSICRRSEFCPHSMAMVIEMDSQELGEQIEEGRYAPCRFVPKKGREKLKPENTWKTQLGDLFDRFQHHTPPDQSHAKFPGGRQAIYVFNPSPYGGDEEVLDISVATRPLAAETAGVPANPKPKKAAKKSPATYRNFSAGVRALAASADPLDREVAEKVSMSTRPYEYYGMRQQVRFPLSTVTSADLLGRLARSGRLFRNAEYHLHDKITPIGWLGDDRFDLRFEVSNHDQTNLILGLCAVGPTATISHKDLKTVAANYFIDAQNRLGLFKTAVPTQLVKSIKTGKPIVVPRDHSGDLIEKVLAMPVGLGVEFAGCDDLRPPAIQTTPRPRIHIKAPSPLSESLEATVNFDYDGVLVPHHRTAGDFFDKTRGALVRLDGDFHEASLEFLKQIGWKFQKNYRQEHWSLPKKKLPAVVGHLIRANWHVEADGKLYRTGSSFDISVVSGIDWFELQGTAKFDQSAIDLPRLLQSLRAGEQTVVLDDGSIGVIPEDWIRRFGGLAELATNEDGKTKFGQAQVGLLDALLVEQGEINVDAKFAAARDSLRQFDKIEPQEPPAGFVGELRPYQKLAQGWFQFLRALGFGGCLADDMGLGKTIQVLAMLEGRRQAKAGPSLIVVPRSLIFNWTAEAKKFAPNLRVLDQSHSQRQKGVDHLSDFDIVLTTYGTLRRDAAFLKDFDFDYIILDEAQAIKNATTEAAKASRLLKGRHRLALSGTPIENHLGELWSLFDFLNPGMLGRVGRFAALAGDADLDQRKLLAAAVRPFILRRTKKEVAPELPDRVEQTVMVELDPDQRKAYDELREYYRKALLTKIDTDGIGKSQIVILEALLRLRQAACHPGLIDKARVNDPSAKLDELLSRLQTAAEAGERTLVFSQFTSLLAIVKLRLMEAGIEYLYLDGKTKDRQSLVDQFQSGTGPAVFLISLKAGGVGLNLTAARSVYLLDPWWNPAVEAQAIDRVHRIGQQQTVFATRLIAADTVEQKVLELQAKKKGLADAIINADNAGISSLTREDVERLLA
jgi:SNF2 family DNA or RNA helicase